MNKIKSKKSMKYGNLLSSGIYMKNEEPEMKYLNSSIRPYFEKNIMSILNEALLEISHERPNKPLLFLAEYLLEKSKEIE